MKSVGCVVVNYPATSGAGQVAIPSPIQGSTLGPVGICTCSSPQTAKCLCDFQIILINLVILLSWCN